ASGKYLIYLAWDQLFGSRNPWHVGLHYSEICKHEKKSLLSEEITYNSILVPMNCCFVASDNRHDLRDDRLYSQLGRDSNTEAELQIATHKLNE
ncbi:hypothetical protein L9F63_000895, partial [Diploptera punctata]